MAYLPDLALAFAAFLVGIISPGPNVMAILSTSLAEGRRPGRTVATGIAAGSATWAVLTAIGLSAVLARFANVLVVVTLAGGCYLAWLAAKALRRALRGADHAEGPAGDAAATAYLRRGYLIQMTNPKAVLTWIAIMSLGLDEGAPLWVPTTIVVGTAMLSYTIHNAYAIAFSTRRLVAGYRRAQRGIDAVMGVVFGAVATRLLTARV